MVTVMNQHTVRLWNGREYPKTVIQELSPELFEYAQSHHTLHEWLPVGLKRILCDYLIVCVAIVLATEMVALVVCVFRLDLLKFPWSYMVPAFLLAVVVVAAGLPLWIVPTLLRGPVKLSVANGMVVLQDGRGPHPRRVAAPLTGCKFYRGPIRLRDRLRTVRRTDGGLILLIPSRHDGTAPGGWRVVTCGFSRRKWALWLSFFMIAGVEHLIPRIYSA